MKKFAVCFSGYPRFVKQSFDGIKNLFLDNLDSYDIFANFQWSSDSWKNQKIHHEFGDKFEDDELSIFRDLYSDLNVKKINVIPPVVYDTSWYSKTSAEPDMPLTLDQSRDILYRFKSQYQGILDCVDLAEMGYEYLIRVRTDLIFTKNVVLDELDPNIILNQDGFCAGFDRPYSDWFFVCPVSKVDFFRDLANIEYHFRDGIIHFHKIIQNLSSKYRIEYRDLGIGTPSTLPNYKYYKIK